MNSEPNSREDVALGVVSGRESAEQASRRLGIPADEIRRWCDLVELGARLGKSRPVSPWQNAALAGFAALMVFSTWARVAISADCNPAAPGMEKICPDTPALAGALNSNFSLISAALKLKFNTTNLDQSPGAWVKANHVGKAELTSVHLAANAFDNATLLGPGSVHGVDLINASVTKPKVKQLPFYKRNVACQDTKRYITTSTCTSSKKTSVPCPPGMGAYYVCDSGSTVTACQASAPTCSNTQLGVLISP